MNDVILSLNDLNKIFQNFVISALGMTNSAIAWKAWKANGNGNEPVNPYYFVRISFPQNGAPAWKVSEDVVFIKCVEIDDSYNRQRDTEYSGIDANTANKQTGYTRVFAVSLVAYGPNSYDNCTKIKNYLFSENRLALNQNGLFLIPDNKAPARLPELFQSQWYERTDCTFNFNNLVSINEIVNNIEDVNIQFGNEQAQSNISVTQPDEIAYSLTDGDLKLAGDNNLIVGN